MSEGLYHLGNVMLPVDETDLNLGMKNSMATYMQQNKMMAEKVGTLTKVTWFIGKIKSYIKVHKTVNIIFGINIYSFLVSKI